MVFIFILPMGNELVKKDAEIMGRDDMEIRKIVTLDIPESEGDYFC